MVIAPKLKIYGIVAGIFVLGAGAGAASGYAVANKRLETVLREDRPGMGDAHRLEALSAQLDLTRDQRRQVRQIMERHRDENRQLARAMFEECGGPLQDLRARVDAEIRAVLTEAQARRFGELMEKRGSRFPLGGPGPRRRKGD
jgi:Spy/CpxP family protein refolding chaperone